MAKLKYGMKHGIWVQTHGDKYFVKPKDLSAGIEPQSGHITIYIYIDNPCIMTSYDLVTYGVRWALEKEELKDIYRIDIPGEIGEINISGTIE